MIKEAWIAICVTTTGGQTAVSQVEPVDKPFFDTHQQCLDAIKGKSYDIKDLKRDCDCARVEQQDNGDQK
jgi:hypothetical protein